MKNYIKIITAVFLGLVCVSTGVLAGDQPSWVEGEANGYPNSQYMTATGSASNAELAKNRALANLSKIFESHVKEITTTKIDTQVSKNNNSESFSKNTHLAQQIQISTDKIINGARVAETWKDKTVFTHHALAVLDRSQAGNNIKGEMTRLDSETQVMMQRSKSQADVLFSLAALDNAVNLQNERLTLQKMLKVIDTRGRGAPSSWNLAELSSSLENKLQSLKIGTSIEKDSSGKLHQLLKSAMGNAGFPSRNTSTQFTLVGSLDVQDLGFRQGWYWLRGKLSVKMVEAGGKIRGRKQWLLKVSALQRDDAESRLLTDASKKMNADLKLAILEFATSSGQ